VDGGLKIQVFIFGVCLLISGCSMLDSFTTFKKYSPTSGTNYVPLCNKDSVCFVLERMHTSRFVGIPYIPFIPVSVYDSPYSFEVKVQIKSDSSNSDIVLPDFGLIPQNCKLPIKPRWVARDAYSEICLFDLRGCNIDTIQVVYTGNTNECNFPTVTYSSSKEIRYQPYVFPRND
jgi:hypothetical protein